MEQSNLEKFEPTILKLAKTWYIPPLEWSDIANELRLHLWKNENKFNSQKATYDNWAYICCRNKIRDLAKYYQAKKRDVRGTVSLDKLISEGVEF